VLTVLVTARPCRTATRHKTLLVEPEQGLPSIRLAWADGGYAGEGWYRAKDPAAPDAENREKPMTAHIQSSCRGRWVVESNPPHPQPVLDSPVNRPHVRDYDRLHAHHETLQSIEAMIS